jgi:predicted ATP-dependent protease
MSDQNNVLHQSLLNSLGAGIMQGLTSAGERSIDPREVARLTLDATHAIEAVDAYQEDIEALAEVKDMLATFIEMREKGQKREIASLAMMAAKQYAGIRTLSRTVLTFMIEMQNVSPAAVNNEHVANITRTFETMQAELVKSIEAGPRKRPTADDVLRGVK